MDKKSGSSEIVYSQGNDFKTLLARLGGASPLIRNIDRSKYESQYGLGVLVVMLSVAYILAIVLKVYNGDQTLYIMEFLVIFYYFVFMFVNAYLLRLVPNIHFAEKRFANERYIFIYLARLLFLCLNMYLLYHFSFKHQLTYKDANGHVQATYASFVFFGFALFALIPYFIKLFRSPTPYDYAVQIESQRESALYKQKIDEYKKELEDIKKGNLTEKDVAQISNKKIRERQHIYIHNIDIQDFRCFEHLKLDLNPGASSTNMLTSIVGDNASGKSTLLKAICLGIVDESASIGLIKAERGKFIRRGEEEAHIRVILRDDLSGKHCYILTIISRDDKTGEEIVRKHIDDRHGIYSNIFLCSYGSHRSNSSDHSVEGYSKYHSTKHLFDKNEKLLNPELIIRRQSTKEQRKVLEILNQISNAPELQSKFELNNKGIEINGHSIDSSSDGFVSTLNWVLDLYGRAIEFGAMRSTDDLVGIVIIDEIETHLHPKWQRIILDKLRTSFPRMQFIITTHTPLILSAASDYEDSVVYRLENDGDSSGHVEIRKENIQHKSIQDIMFDGFNVETIQSPLSQKMSRRYDELLNNKDRTKIEQTELEDLRKNLYQDFEEMNLSQEELKSQLKKFK